MARSRSVSCEIASFLLMMILFQTTIVSSSESTSQKTLKEISTNNNNNNSTSNTSSGSSTKSEVIATINNGANINENKDVLDITISHVSRDSHREKLLSISWKLKKSYFSNSINSNDDYSEYYVTVNNTKLYLDGFVISSTFYENRKHPEDKYHLSDVGMEFKSPIISINSTFLILHDITITQVAEKDAMLKFCVYVLFKSNETNSSERSRTMTKTCHDYTKNDDSNDVESKVNHVRKMWAGIGAGLVFLIPCGVVLFFILRKDKRMRLSEIYEKENGMLLNSGFELGKEEGIAGNGLKHASRKEDNVKDKKDIHVEENGTRVIIEKL